MTSVVFIYSVQQMSAFIKAIFLSGNGFDLILIILSGFIEIIAISADGMPTL